MNLTSPIPESFESKDKDGVVYVSITDIKEESPFKDLFEINQETQDAIINHMSWFGYDPSQPMGLWKEKKILITGYTRFQAVKYLSSHRRQLRAIKGEFDVVPVVELSFETEEEAVKYAIHSQIERRNLTDYDIFKLFQKVDRPSSNWGGTRQKDDGSSSLGNPKLEDSRERTAAIIGTSKDKVSYCRRILEEKDEKIIQAVQRGEKTLYRAYWELMEGKRRKDRKQEEGNERNEILQKIDTTPFKTGDKRGQLSAYRKRREHLERLCVRLLSELLKKGPLMEEIKEHILFFQNEGKGMFEALSNQAYIQEFLASPFVDDFIFVLALFGFEIKKPEGLPPTVRPEKPAPKKRPAPVFNIGKVHDAEYVGNEQAARIGKSWADALTERERRGEA